MPLHRWSIGRALVIAALAAACLAPPAHALRVMTWNISQYPQNLLSTRQPNFRTVMANVNADILIAQELDSSAGRDSFFLNVLNVVEPGQWTETSWVNLGSNEGGAVFYKPAKVAVTNLSSFGAGGPRAVLQCVVTPVGYTATAGTFRLYSMHLKAGGPATTDSTTRRTECTNIRLTLNTLPAGTNFVLGGDSNFYGAYEGGYHRLTESQGLPGNNNGRFKDPLAVYGLGGSTTNWHANSGFALWDTQCPCQDGTGGLGCLANFSGGGMDDRFDLLLTSYSLQDGQGVDYLPDLTITDGAMPYSYGNDGSKYNKDINDGGTNGMVGVTIANALHDASDHLPVVITIQVAAKVVTDASLAFGSVLVGATASQNLSVSNGATIPADALSYTLSAPAGFTAPGGAFEQAAGDPAALQAIGMNTVTRGARSGNLAVNSDDVDLPVKNVPLSGTVLSHAVASLDSATIQTAASVDFGMHELGGFADHAVRVHDQGYDALEARLAVGSANIVGGDGRFSIVGGFSPTLLAGTGKTWNIHFNDAGANIDQDYDATLTLSSADEALPGAAAATDLVVSLHARPLSGPVGVPVRDLPKVLAFYPPYPNPIAHDALFAYDLPVAAPVSLAIYDLSGRRIATLASGTQEPDRYQVHWNAVSDAGAAVPAGLYFARFSAPGMTRLTRLIVLP
jgi:endonuclease/exonuclease/phosphatase family metal-dependent hydrolase